MPKSYGEGPSYPPGEGEENSEAAMRAVKDNVRNLKETGIELASKADSEATDVARHVSSRASNVASDLTQKGEDMAGAARAQAKTMTSALEETVRRNPLGLLAGALVAGVVIGMIGRRR